MTQLSYAPKQEFDRILAIDCPATDKAELFATLSRINVLYMVAQAGSGHLGSSFSSLDIVSWLFLNEMESGSGAGEDNLYFSSKGHDAPGVYSALIGLGKLDFDLLHQLRRLGGLPGHPDVSTPYMPTNTGSLGMGISKAKGMVTANRLAGKESQIFVMTGDGELQEGQIWESLISAANRNMHEITVIVDHNKIQSDIWVSCTNDLGDLEAKFAAFGWYVQRCDGHDFEALSQALANANQEKERPQVIIADTVKGQGVSFMRHQVPADDRSLYGFHSGAPSPENYEGALAELKKKADALCEPLGQPALSLESVDPPVRPVVEDPQKLIAAYSKALVKQAESNPKIVALDADLKLDCGLIPFEDKFPERFVECGIAEMDMVSMAGGLALSGYLPVVHSFACFLSTRPNEHFYNNATEHTKVVYAGSLAGLLPGGPGHSHQSVRDISALGGIPGLTLIQPCCEAEVEIALDYALNKTEQSTYIRLVTIPCPISFSLPQDYQLALGKGTVLREGDDAAVFAYGPVMVEQAYKASIMLEEEHGKKVCVINLPWLNNVDRAWLEGAVADKGKIFTVDDHYIRGGQGELIAANLCREVIHMGLTEVPACGLNDEVLKHHGLDARSIAESILDHLE